MHFLSQKGCRYGGSCKNVHSMNELSTGDRFKKCLHCGSEEHRAKDCDRPNKAGKSGPKDQNPKPITQVAQVTPSPSAASTSPPIVQATPVLSPDLLQQAAEMYRQLQAMQVPHHCQLLSLLSHYHCPLPRRKAAAHSSHQAHHNRSSNVWPSPPEAKILVSQPPPWRLRGRGWELPQTAKIRTSQTPISEAKTRVWEEVKMVGLKAKRATSAPSPPFRLENWDLGQKRDFAP